MAVLGYICRGFEFLVAPLLMGPVYLLSQGRFEEPVRRWPFFLATRHIVRCTFCAYGCRRDQASLCLSSFQVAAAIASNELSHNRHVRTAR